MQHPQLLSNADKVVRSLLPLMLESIGQAQDASTLRGLEPFRNARSVMLAAVALEQLQLRGGDRFLVAHFCEKAVWAAVAGDARAFSRNVDRAHAAMRENLGPFRGPAN